MLPCSRLILTFFFVRPDKDAILRQACDVEYVHDNTQANPINYEKSYKMSKFGHDTLTFIHDILKIQTRSSCRSQSSILSL